jgi:hypothetical protein
VEPYIRVATGDFRDIARSSGMNNALASIIVSVAHEVVHYRQWVETGNVWEQGTGRQAEAILKKYAKETGFGGVPLPDFS